MNTGIKYHKYKVDKKILDNNYDLPIALLSNDIAYDKISHNYREFLHGVEGSIGFLRGFNELRSNAINQAVTIHQKYFSDPNKTAFDINIFVDHARRVSRIQYWKTKDYLSQQLNSPSLYGDNEELVPYIIGNKEGLEVHHLHRIKSFVHDNMSLDDVLKATDPKYQVAMTGKGHRGGEKIGHDGHTGNDPKINDPFELEASIPNEYYKSLEGKREELINFDLADTGLYVGGVSILLLATLLKQKNSGNLIHNQITLNRLEKSFIKLSVFGLGISSREGFRNVTQESSFIQQRLFELRDDFLILNTTKFNIFGDNFIDSIGNIDQFADALSIAPLSIVIQGGRLFEDYRNRGYIDKEIAIKHGKQAITQTVIFGGGKYALTMFMDPTGATITLVVFYAGLNLLSSNMELRKQNRIREEDETQLLEYINKQLKKMENSEKN